MHSSLHLQKYKPNKFYINQEPSQIKTQGSDKFINIKLHTITKMSRNGGKETYQTH